MKKSSMKLATVGALLASGSIANAALINLNYNGGGDSPLESSLSGPGGGLGTTWNQVSASGPTGALFDSNGGTTGVSVTTGGYDSAPALGAQTSGTLPIFRSHLNVFSRPNTSTVTISGLASGGVYDIWLLSYRDLLNVATERSSGTWATTNTTTSSSSQVVSSQVQGTNGGSFVEGYNYALFSNVEATVGGVISFTASGAGAGSPQDGNSRRLHLNGLQINAVPEPSTALLGGLGLLALLRRRRA